MLTFPFLILWFCRYPFTAYNTTESTDVSGLNTYIVHVTPPTARTEDAESYHNSFLPFISDDQRMLYSYSHLMTGFTLLMKLKPWRPWTALFLLDLNESYIYIQLALPSC